jgi:hypothetical protein
MQMKLLGITTVNFDIIGRLIRFYNHQVGLLGKKWEHNDTTVHQLFIDFKKAYDTV